MGYITEREAAVPDNSPEFGNRPNGDLLHDLQVIGR